MLQFNNHYAFFFRGCCLLLLSLIGVHVNASTQSDFQDRQTAYRQTVIAEYNLAVADDTDEIEPDKQALPILAVEGIEDQSLADEQITSYESSDNADFSLITLIRLLYLTDDYDTKIEASIAGSGVPMWVENGEEVYIYWSENHMIQWMSSHWLWNQYMGLAQDADFEARLLHFLDVKIDYGYYEFLSPTYFPYTMSALLNLVDFATDQVIQSKAKSAVDRLLTEALLVTNDMGTFYPAAGRTKTGKYIGRGGDHHQIVSILTGLGDTPTTASKGAAYLATSSIDMAAVIESRNASEDLEWTNGHNLTGDGVHSGMSRKERTLFQWSAGGYFHPDGWSDTFYTIDEYELENHDAFSGASALQVAGKDITKSFTSGSNISKLKINIFKDDSVVLTSLEKHYGGKVGYQAWPWVATIEDIAVWTQSGKNKTDWTNRDSQIANAHLPKVIQDGNLVTVTYWPDSIIGSGIADTFFDALDTEVALYWPSEEFDEEAEVGRWIVGRKNSSYIAVYRKCTTIEKGNYTCDGDDGRQFWAALVGNWKSHGTFEEFKTMLADTTNKSNEYWSFKTSCGCKRYKTKFEVDGKEIVNSWDKGLLE
jgi:hypothetical protein